MLIYKITEVLGILVILIALLYALKGLLQLIKRKSLLKVNSEILLVGSLYLVVILVYIFFEKFIINYRPILIDNELEASYPSSHTILALCICTSALMINKYLFSNKKFVKYYNAYIVVLLVGVLAGRILSGVHWLSDIVGGIIISITLLQIFRTVLWQIKNRIN
jgi:undecaprenyl-diphosphatase